MFSLSTEVYGAIWAEMHLPPMPARIAVTQRGPTLAERSRIRAAALVEAQRLGLGAPPDLDQRLADLLELLARHTRALSWREVAGQRRRAYAAASGRHGALAVIERGQVSIVAVSGDHLAGELLTLLPPLPPGPGRAVSVPSSEFAAAIRAYDDRADSSRARGILRAAGIGGKDIERMLAIARQAVGSGSIGVHKGDYGNVKLVGSLAYTDTAQGRYSVLQRSDRAGRPYTTIIPIDLDGLRQRIHELLAAADRR